MPDITPMSPPCQRVLVTGGAGFVGREVTALLSAKGYDVVVADDLSNPQSTVQPWYRFLQIDVGNTDACLEALEGVNACIALASRRGAIGYAHRNPVEVIDGNSKIHSGTFNAAAQAGLRRLVFISSSMVYENSTRYPAHEDDILDYPPTLSPFGFSKLSGERYCKAFHQSFGLPFTILRPANIYGPNEAPAEAVGDSHVIPDLFKKITRGQYPVEVLGNGRQSRSFVHVKDVARGIVAALESASAENETFNLGGTEETEIQALVHMIWRLIGMNHPCQITATPGFPMDVPRQLLSIEKARSSLGWQPEIRFDEGLAEVVAWLKRHHAPTAHAA